MLVFSMVEKIGRGLLNPLIKSIDEEMKYRVICIFSARSENPMPGRNDVTQAVEKKDYDRNSGLFDRLRQCRSVKSQRSSGNLLTL